MSIFVEEFYISFNFWFYMGIFFKRFFATILGILASVIIFIVAISAIVSGVVGVLTPSLAELPKVGTLLEINMGEQIIESPTLTPIVDLSRMALNTALPTTLFATLSALDAAAEDPNITAISLRLDGEYAISLANIAEIRDALIEFRAKSQKPIFAYAEEFSQSEYYLASIADKIYINPLGGIEWIGVATNALYYGDLLKRVGVKAEIFRPESCSYKSAVEPFISNKMSPESREQNQRIVDSYWGMIVDEVAVARSIAAATLRSIAENEIVVEPQSALDNKMVTNIGYRDQYDAALREVGIVEDDSKLRTITLADYAWQIESQTEKLMALSTNKKIALLYAEGTIYDGDEAAPTQLEVVSGDLVRQLRWARNNDEISAVVLRVNSPGGSALASDVIWREMMLLRNEKPIIVSMGSYAASGGYYISSPADIILANRYTLTGSIGVFGAMFAYEESLRENLHIAIDGVVSSASADFGFSPREISPIERAAVMRSVDGVYATFKERVAEGRNLSPAVVAVLSGGRVWCGKEAVDCSLADALGGLKGALALAADRGGVAVDAIEVVGYQGEMSDWELLVNSIVASADFDLYAELRGIVKSNDKIMMLAPEKVEF